MKIKLNKDAMINWPRKEDRDKCDIYQFTEGEYSADLPEDVAKYVLDNYEGKIIDVLDEKAVPRKSVEDQVKDIKAQAPKKVEEFNKQKEEKKEALEKNTGLKLSDLAKNA